MPTDPSLWCLAGGSIGWADNDFTLCTRRSVVNGLVPAILGFISSVFMLRILVRAYLFVNTAPKNNHLNTATQSFSPTTIHDAETLVLRNSVEKLGLSWGGRSLSRYGKETLNGCIVEFPLPRGQRYKNAFVTVSMFATTCLLTAKAILTNQLPKDSTFRGGMGWTITEAVVWLYFSALSIARLQSKDSDAAVLSISTVEKHIIPYLIFYPSLICIEFRSSIIQMHQSHYHHTMFIIYTFVFAFSLFISLAELHTPRASPYVPPQKDKKGSPPGHRGSNGISHERTPLLAEPERSNTESTPNPGRQPPAVEIKASLMSQYTFQFINEFMIKFWRTKPQEDEIPGLLPDNFAASLAQRYRDETAHLTKWGPIVKVFWHLRAEFLKQALWTLLQPALLVLPSIILKILLDIISARGSNESNAPPLHVVVFIVLMLPLSQVLNAIASSQALMIGRRLSVRLHAIFEVEMFAKVLRRSDYVSQNSGERSEKDKESDDDEDHKVSSAGRIQVLISNDLFNLSEICAYLHWFASMPVLAVFAIAYLFHVLGLAALAGILAMAIFFVIAYIGGKKFIDFQNEMRKASDERVKLVTEAIQAIKTLKFFSWEERFIAKMEIPRKKELNELIKRQLALAVQVVILTAGPNLFAALSFGVHTLVLGRTLTASTAFTSLSLFNTLRDPLDIIADMAAHVLEALVALRRIQAFLYEEESHKYEVLQNDVGSSGENDFVGFEDAKFVWYRSATGGGASVENFVLDIGTLKFPRGQLSMIAGPVGSGKSSVLLALLGEMDKVHGKIRLRSSPIRTLGDPNILTESVAYCAQTPWLLSATLKENILFGAQYDAERYLEVLQACALEPDIASLDLRDETEVGEKGTVLSGGQKARICLARALYSSAKYLLLDDVLSAVDSHTSEHLHDYCLKGRLMQDRTCILVTHAVPLCAPTSKLAVVLSEGTIEQCGDPKELGLVDFAYAKSRVASLRTEAQSVKSNSSTDLLAASQVLAENPADKDMKNKQLKLIKEEEQSTGAVSLAVYKMYASAFGGWPAWLTSISLYAIAQIMDVILQWWLRNWANTYDTVEATIKYTSFRVASVAAFPTNLVRNIGPSSTVIPLEEHDKTVYYLKIYSVLALITLVFYALRMTHFLVCAVRAGRVLYNRLIRRIMGAQVRFFESTPVGRILNRISKDTEAVDDDVGTIGMFMMLEVLWTVGITGAIAFVVPSFLIAAVFILMIYIAISVFYLGSSREVKRLESVTQSPIFSLFGEAMNGVTTIRAYGDTGRFLEKMLGHIDDNNRPYYNLWLANRWLSVRVDMTSALVILITAVSVLVVSSKDAASAGFVLSFALLFQERLLWVVRNMATLEIAFNSVERIREYSQLEQEKTDGIDPPAHWPSREGQIEVKDLCVRYDVNFSRVLHNVSFTVNPKEKVGIVGRTGSGKSTLALSFFRFVEAEAGSITVDGLDISKVKLSTLRSRLVILPQDATLFIGTVRFNLDPFDQHDDIELWDALQKVGLVNARTPASTPAVSRGSSRIRSPTGSGLALSQADNADSEGDLSLVKGNVVTSLEMAVEDGGKNFSAGQKQLLALARGLLRLARSSIVILDEASASLDARTDEQVQKTIRREMGEATLLCIAHRLRTIIGFDKVLVLGEGKVLEYGGPAELLADKQSEFAELCRRTGEFDRLFEMARAAHNLRQSKT